MTRRRPPPRLPAAAPHARPDARSPEVCAHAAVTRDTHPIDSRIPGPTTRTRRRRDGGKTRHVPAPVPTPGMPTIQYT